MNLLELYVPEEIFVALSLLVLVLVLRRVFWKPLMKIVDGRRADVDDMLRRAEDAKKIIADMEAQRKSHDAEIERRVVELMREAREHANREYDRIVSEAEEKARKFTEAGEGNARRAYEQAMGESREAIIALAMGAASIIVESSMDSEKNRNLIETMLQKAGAGNG